MKYLLNIYVKLKEKDLAFLNELLILLLEYYK